MFAEHGADFCFVFLFPSAAAFVGFTAIILTSDVIQTLPRPLTPTLTPTHLILPTLIFLFLLTNFFLHLLFTFDLSLETQVCWTALGPAAVVLGTVVSCRDGGQTSVTPLCSEPDLPGL